MAKENKTVLIIAGLVVVGGAVLYFAAGNNNSSNQVVMKDVFSQSTSTVSTKTLEAQHDPVPSPAIVTSPEHGKEAGFAVQVYSFKDQKRASAALDHLKGNGFNNAYIEMSDLGDKGAWYRVRVGGLKDEAQAKAMLENVRKNFNSAIIVKAK